MDTNQSVSFLMNHLLQGTSTIQHCVINAGKVVLARKNPNIAQIINNCSIVNADGQSVVWASHFLGTPVPERVTGIDLMHRLLDQMQNSGVGAFFLGGTEPVVSAAVDVLQNQYPGLSIVGWRNGYWSEAEEASVLDLVRSSGAGILFLAFPSPRKEYFANKYLHAFGVQIVFGIGGTLDVIAGKTKRAPEVWQKLGLEWFYRFLQEPQRMWRRYLVGNLEFLAIILRQKISSIDTRKN